MEIIDKDRKSLINRKTVAEIIDLQPWHWQGLAIVFTDKSYLILASQGQSVNYFGGFGSIPDVFAREYMVDRVLGWGNQPGSEPDAITQKLIDLGLYTKEQIAEMVSQHNRQYKKDLIERIGSLKRDAARMEQFLTSVSDKE